MGLLKKIKKLRGSSNQHEEKNTSIASFSLLNPGVSPDSPSEFVPSDLYGEDDKDTTSNSDREQRMDSNHYTPPHARPQYSREEERMITQDPQGANCESQDVSSISDSFHTVDPNKKNDSPSNSILMTNESTPSSKCVYSPPEIIRQQNGQSLVSQMRLQSSPQSNYYSNANRIIYNGAQPNHILDIIQNPLINPRHNNTNYPTQRNIDSGQQLTSLSPTSITENTYYYDGGNLGNHNLNSTQQHHGHPFNQLQKPMTNNSFGNAPNILASHPIHKLREPAKTSNISGQNMESNDSPTSKKNNNKATKEELFDISKAGNPNLSNTVINVSILDEQFDITSQLTDERRYQVGGCCIDTQINQGCGASPLENIVQTFESLFVPTSQLQQQKQLRLSRSQNFSQDLETSQIFLNKNDRCLSKGKKKTNTSRRKSKESRQKARSKSSSKSRSRKKIQPSFSEESSSDSSSGTSSGESESEVSIVRRKTRKKAKSRKKK